MTHNARSYVAYGLGIRSEIPLPLPLASAEAAVDVRIRIGEVPEALTAPRAECGLWQAASGVFLLVADDVARFLVRSGQEITVEPASNGEGSVSAFLLGSVLAACLKQRGVLTLHASGIATDAGAVLFAGHSGSGKSTLLAALLERGHEMLCDDVSGILPAAAGRPVALPAYPRIRLWKDAVDMLGWNGRMQGRVREDMEKFLAPPERFREAPLPVRGVFMLTLHNKDGIRIEAPPPGAAFEQLLRHTYRKRYAHGLGQGPAQFQALAALAARVPVVRLAQPVARFPIEALAEKVEACLCDGWPKRTEGTDPSTWRAPRPRLKLVEHARLQESPDGPIVWLASYPRSGNTWLRALLTNYLQHGAGPASLDELVGWPTFITRDVFDELLGLSSSDLTAEEILRVRPRFHEMLVAGLPRPSFLKVHDACLRTAAGELLFPSSVTSGAVYLVRNPLDVAVSNAHFWNWSIAGSVAQICSPDAALSQPAGGIHHVLPQTLLSWSGHVASWLDQGELPVHVLRYEDLLEKPEGAFEAVLRFAGIEADAGRISRAVERARFERLRDQEKRSGFVERPPTARAFFRSGQAGKWRGELSRDQVQALIDAHGPMMERLGYLDEAEAFLADGP